MGLSDPMFDAPLQVRDAFLEALKKEHAKMHPGKEQASAI